MRICSLLPTATEILFALGLGDDVVGVSHECEFPPEARRKPRVVDTLVDQDRLTSGEIDQLVKRSLHERTSLYRLDLARIQELKPDLVVTQQLCEVCAIETGEVFRALATLPSPPKLLSLHPHTLQGVFDDILAVGRATGREAQADALVASLRARIARVQESLAGDRAGTDLAGERSERSESRSWDEEVPRAAERAAVEPARVACIEWMEPLMACGHWVPEQVRLAGGREVLGREGAPSRYVTWEELVESRPDVLILMPCGFPVARTRRELAVLTARPEWPRIPAVQAGRVYAVDGPAYFNQSGPRLVDGIELLANLLHHKRGAFYAVQ